MILYLANHKMGCLKLTYQTTKSPLYVSANNFGVDEKRGLEWNHFEAREYGSRIGRWTATDPYRAGFSPYWSMNNNPIYYVDPDGRCPDCEFIENPFEGQSVSFGYGDDIAEYMYSGGDWLRIGGMLNEVVVTPSGWDNTLDFGSSAGLNIVNPISYVGSAILMPIINQFGGGNVEWAKVYTFDKNWKYNGKNLDDGNLSNEESTEMMHYTFAAMTNIIPTIPILKTASPLINGVGNRIITHTATEIAQEVVDYSIGYHE